MAKVQKVDLNLGQKIINPFKTSRNSTTNPFKYQDFEGNTLDVSLCADIFEGEAKKTNKLKLISSSVMGSVTKLRSSITEPIVNFIKRIGLADGIKTISEVLNKDILDVGKDIGHSISDSVSGLKKGIQDKISGINSDLTELGKDISDKWIALVGKIHHNKITKDTTVAELRTMWEEEIAAAKEAA